MFLPPIGLYELSPFHYFIEFEKKITLFAKYTSKIYEIGEMLSKQKTIVGCLDTGITRHAEILFFTLYVKARLHSKF